MKLGPTKRAVCHGCRLDTYLHHHPDGWECLDCGTILEEHRPPPQPLADPPHYGRNATLLPPAEARRAIRLYRSGSTVNKIARTLKRDHRRVGLTLHTYGVVFRERVVGKPAVCGKNGHRWTKANTLIVNGRRTCRGCFEMREAAIVAKLEERKQARARRIARRKRAA